MTKVGLCGTLIASLGTLISLGSVEPSSGAGVDRVCLIRVSRGPLVSPSTQELAFTLKLTNTDSVACSIDGYATVRFEGTNAAMLPFVYRQRPNGAFAFTAAAPTRFVLKSFASAYVLVAKEACVGPDGRSAVTATVLAPSLQAGTLAWVLQLSGDYPRIFVCTGPDAAANNIVAVSPVEPSVKDLY